MRLARFSATVSIAFMLVSCSPGGCAVPVTEVNTSGRYVAFSNITNSNNYQFILDTQTGRLWKIAGHEPKNPDTTAVMILQPVPYMDVGGGGGDLVLDGGLVQGKFGVLPR